MFFSDIHTRIRFFFLFSLCILIIIIICVFYIRVIDYQKLSDLASSLWSRELPIGADRGEILDQNGKAYYSNDNFNKSKGTSIRNY